MADTTDAGPGRLLEGLDACVVSDALDTLGLGGAVTGVRPLWQVQGTVSGRVRTIQASPKSSDTPGQHIASRMVADAAAGDVLVIANAGREDVSCWGGILSVAAIERGVAAVVIDGACRDISESSELGLPIFGRAVVPVSARGRIVQTAMDSQIDFAGVSVDSGDYVIADQSGVVFVPEARAEEVADLARRIAAREAAMIAAVREGESVAEVMHDSRFPQPEGNR